MGGLRMNEDITSIKLEPTKPPKRMTPPEERQSKYQSWLYDLIAIDSLRKVASQKFVEMRVYPYKVTECVDAINEMYRVIRPLVTSDQQRFFDGLMEDANAKAEEFARQYRRRMLDDPLYFEELDGGLRSYINKIYHRIYELRQDYGLGFRTVGRSITGSEAARRSLSI